MISERSRVILDRYALASNALSRESGERMATEAGQSVEFHDFRPYFWGDELRYVDWKAYARTGRLYTRLYQAERNIAVHILLDTSPSMSLGGKAAYARTLAQLLAYTAHRDAKSQVHLFDGSRSRPGKGRVQVPAVWSFIEQAPSLEGDAHRPGEAIKSFALTSPAASSGLVLIISDLFDEAGLQNALAALRYRRFDASFLQVMAREDLEPAEGQLELVDAETGSKMVVGPEEVRAYRQAVQRFIVRTRTAILRVGFRHILLKSEGDEETAEKEAFKALLAAGILIKR